PEELAHKSALTLKLVQQIINHSHGVLSNFNPRAEIETPHTMYWNSMWNGLYFKDIGGWARWTTVRRFNMVMSYGRWMVDVTPDFINLHIFGRRSEYALQNLKGSP